MDAMGKNIELIVENDSKREELNRNDRQASKAGPYMWKQDGLALEM